ncbi:MAG: bifunctional phosphoribosylaminoimidazolecarboxamide formyltransferase/IMP cyclohydrolase [Acidobacteria bacterium]|nr:MAG: bifunctional phosphoribosylaminoimidazolecarboxamide formyltransferase/IMP cyclohydrolase [Acidobacteriota bacterium]
MDRTIRRALLSVFDKDGILELAHALSGRSVQILSSGGTARLLQENDIAVTTVPDHTGFPEMLDGRVKTLHPKIHGGILALRDNASHVEDLAKNGIEPIDLVVVNLYPFEKTARTEGISLGDVIEMIDIGGPAMVRAAAKNYAYVGVVVDPADYATVTTEITTDGCLSDATRQRLAVKAFLHTSEYDTAVHAYLSRIDRGTADADVMPDKLSINWVKVQGLRYGENPHQKAAFYAEPAATGLALPAAKQLQGKELSFNNILDFDAALGVVAEFDRGACAIIKHGNPCGAAIGSDPRTAFDRALECDPLSAFGGVIAFNRGVDAHAAEAIAEHFFEGVIAPCFDNEARERLARKKKLRLLETGDLAGARRGGLDLRRVSGGLLAQDWDRVDENVRDARVVTKKTPSEKQWQALEFAWIVCKHVKSNAIVYTDAKRTIGIGAGQMSRVDAARLGVEKARSPIRGTVMASDAFFPFRDGIDAAAEAGVCAVIQPGGSIRDEEVIAAADEHGLVMVFTGRRHFRH